MRLFWEINVYEMFAYLASNGQDLPLPIAEVHVEVYTKAYNSLMQYLANSGMDITIKKHQVEKMEIIAVESQAYQELIDKLNRIEQYVERTSRLIQDIDDELEMTTKDLIGTLNVSRVHLYRWRKKQLVRYRYTEGGDVRYSHSSLS